jgi:branched-chain amino acid transport system substrate-binding protein
MSRVLRRVRLGISAFLFGATLIGAIAVPVSVGAASKGLFKIGFVCSCTGAYASSLGVSSGAFNAWADYVNAHGGIDGRKVQIFVGDDANNPVTSISEAEKMISQDGVSILTDNSNVDSGWANYARSHKVPVVGLAGDTTAESSNPDFFPIGQTQDSVNTAEAYAAKKMGGTKLALLYCAEAAVCAEGVAPLKAAGAKLGVPMVYNTAITYDAPNYTAQCLAAKEAGADVVWIAQGASATLAAGNSCAQQGYTPIELNNSSGATNEFLTASAFNNHMISVQPDLPFSAKSTPASKLMYTVLKKYDPSALSPTNLNSDVQQAWTTGAAIKKAAQLGGGTTSADITKGLYKFHNETLGGLAPPLNYAKGKAHVVDCWFYLRVQGGKFTTPYGLAPICHADIQ